MPRKIYITSKKRNNFNKLPFYYVWLSRMDCSPAAQVLQTSNFFQLEIRVSILCLCHAKRFTKPLIFTLAFLFYLSLAVAQQVIKGTVTTSDGSLLSNVTVMIKGTQRATLTDNDGSFSIAAKIGETLVISNIGYRSVEVKIVNEPVLNISLSEFVSDLDEVVLTGYSYQKLKEITGSIAIVKPKDLLAVPAGQVEQMLQGRVAGLNIITSGEPGSASNVRLHGIGNFGDVTPLYIIDGVEGNINSINPYDIESIQVLKDAGAYSIYGVRGANGVIVLTTKKGKSGRTRLDYDFYLGTTRPIEKGFDLLTPQENADILWMALKRSGFVNSLGNPSYPLYGNGPTPVLPDYFFAGPVGVLEGDPRVNPDLYNLDPLAGPIYQIVPFEKKGVNWIDEIFNPAISQNHTITASGGNDMNRYLFSLGYLDQQGTLINTYLKRFTTRINTEFTILKNFRIGENLQLNYTQNPQTGNQLAPYFQVDPYLPVYDIKGNWSSYGNPVTAGPAENPKARRILSKDDKDHGWQVFGNVYAEVDFLKKFTFRSSFGGTLNYNYSYNYNFGTYTPPPVGRHGSFSERSGYAKTWIWTNTLSFQTRFKNHHLTVFAGIEDRSSYTRGMGGNRIGYFTNDPNYRLLTTGNPVGQSNFSVAGISYLHSYIGQVNYAFNEKYFLTGTLRRDGSSVFGSENRFGWFPSLSAAWRISEENFINTVEWITDLKLRASWGKTGYNGNTDPFNQFTLFGGGPGDAFYDINGTSNSVQQGFRVVRTGNPRTGWQKDIVTNIGFESMFWNGKLSITADWYNKISSGLLFPVPLPALLGDATPPNGNIGNVKNTGIDIMIGSRGSFSKHWTWDARVTFTHYVNKIVKLNGLPYIDDFPTFYGSFVRNEVGHPLSSFFGYKIIGFFDDSADVSKSPHQASAAPGRFKYLDANDDGHIDDRDRVHFGNPNPAFTLGFNIGLTYRNFDFSTFLYGSFGNDLMNNWTYTLDVFPSNLFLTPKSKTALYNSWTPGNKNAKAPIIEADQNFSNGAVINSYRVEKGTYVRNKTMILGYTFSGGWLQEMHIEKLRVYVQAANLFTITNYTGMDPELSGKSATYGIDYYGNYPNNQKQFLVGFNLSFE